MFDFIPILTGPTGCGKTELAIEYVLSKKQPIEIINADSLLVYRYFNMGTAKPTLEEQKGIPHHLIDVVDPESRFTAGDFVRKVESLLEDFKSRGVKPLIVGGTGFYLKALTHGLWNAKPEDLTLRDELEKNSNDTLYQELFILDPKTALRIGKNDRYRLIRSLEIIQQTGLTPTEHQEKNKTPQNSPYKVFLIDRHKDELEVRIKNRIQKMLNQGWIEEVKNLRTKYPKASALKSVGYQQILNYLDDLLPPGRKLKAGLEGLENEIFLATRQLIKKQRTWFLKEHTPFMLDQEKNSLFNKLDIGFILN